MEINIHIGYHKTGTSYLQKVIFPKLNNINFINADDNKEFFLKLFFQDPLNFNLNNTLADFKKKINQKKTTLISAEGLSGGPGYKHINNKNIADKLYALFPRAKIIVVIRNQLDLILSFYKLHIEGGGIMSFKKYIGYNNGEFITSYKIYDSRVNLDMFKFKNLVDYYSKKFGKENLLILFYEEFYQDKYTYLRKIFDFMNLNTPPEKFGKGLDRVVNKSFCRNQVFIARIWNQFIPSQHNRNPIIPRIPIPFLGRVCAININKKILKSKLSFRLLGNRDIKISDEIKHQIKSYYNESNRELDEQYKLNLPDCYFL